MKKQNICAGIFLGALLFFMAACTPLFDPPETQLSPAAAGGGEGTVVLSINPSDARTLAPDPDFVKYEVHFYKTTKQAVEIPDVGTIVIGDIDASSGGVVYIPVVPDPEYITTVEKSLTVTSIGSVQESLEAGWWQIAVVGYVNVEGTPVASVYGTSASLNIKAGEVKKISVFLDTPAALDVPGYLEYDIAVPSKVASNYVPDRDAYNGVGITPSPSGMDSGGDFIQVGSNDPGDYFSGAVLRIIPDKASTTHSDFITDAFNDEYVGLVDNQGRIFIDLKYGDESPGNGNPRGDPNRLAQGKIELPPGRYTLYLSLVADRSIDDDQNSPEDYIGIFKEEVVYIYPNMTTKTPKAYTSFEDKDLTAQVFFEGHATVHDPYGTGRVYTPNKVWIARNNNPTYADSSHGEWSATIDPSSGEWNLYIPSHNIADALGYGASGQSLYFRFEMEDETNDRTLLSPWQEYKTQEKQGQVDIDLYAHIETITTPSSVTIDTSGYYERTIQQISASSTDGYMYDVVRGVNFYDTEANKVLLSVTPTDGKAIAYFEARTDSDRAIAWRYADSNFSYPYSYPYAANSSPVVYEIYNGNNPGVLNHEGDNNRPSNGADLGDSPVTITTDFFNFNVALTLPTTNFPDYDRVRLEVYETSTNTLLANEIKTTSTPAQSYNWTFAPGDELTVFDTDLLLPTPTGTPRYTDTDYSIYTYDTNGYPADPNKVLLDNYNYENYNYTTTKGVSFVVVFEDLDVSGAVLASYRTARTRRYTPKELIDQVSLGIASTYEIPDTATQTIAGNDSGLSGLSYASPVQYYYFFAAPGDPYWLEYQDGNTTTGLTGNVSVRYYYNGIQNGTLNNIATVIPATTANTPVLVTVAVSPNTSFSDPYGTYKLIKKTSTIPVQAAEQTFTIPANTTRYYTFTPPNNTATYNLSFKGNSTDSTLANVDVRAFAYDADNPGGITSTSITLTDGAALVPPTLPLLSPARKAVLITVRSLSSSEGEFKITVKEEVPNITPGAAEQSLTIAAGATQYYTFTPSNDTATYDLSFKGVTADAASANVSVSVYTHTAPHTWSSATSLTDNAAATTFSPAGKKVFIVVTDNTVLPSADPPKGFKITVAPTP